MGIEQSGGTDTRVEGADKPQSQERPPPPPTDRPGQPGSPSRLESLRAAREAQEARAAELESRQTTPPENGTEERGEEEDKKTESSPPSPAEQRGTQEESRGAGAAEAADENDESAELEDREASRPGPECTEAPRPDASEEQPAAASRDEPASAENADQPESSLAEDTEPSSDEVAVELSDLLAEIEATEGPSAPHEDKPEPGSVSRPEGRGEDRGIPETRADAPQATDGPDRSEAGDDQHPQQDRPPLGTNNPAENSVVTASGKSEIERQLDLGNRLAQLADKKVDAEIDQTLTKVNPKFDRASSAYSENCTGVVQANELRRRGHDVEAGPLEKHLRSDQNGPGGRDLSVIEQAWGGKFTRGTKAEIEEAFKQPGARGIVYP